MLHPNIIWQRRCIHSKKRCGIITCVLLAIIAISVGIAFYIHLHVDDYEVDEDIQKVLLSETIKMVSLGSNCVVRYRIKELFKMCGLDQGPSNFFDNTVQSFEAVIDIMSTPDVAQLFMDSNLNETGKHDEKNTKIQMISNGWTSIHDVPMEKTQSQMQEFKEKYLRRHKRLIDLIKTDQFQMYFIRRGSVSMTEKESFIQMIQGMNPQCQFLLVSLSGSDGEVEIVKERHFVRIHLSDEFRLRPPVDGEHWTRPDVNWRAAWHFVLRNTTHLL